MNIATDAMPALLMKKSYIDEPEFVHLGRVTRSYYWDFYTLAWNADAAGDIVNRDTKKPLNEKDIAWRIRESLDDVTTALAALEEAGFMRKSNNTWTIVRYEREQIVQSERRKIHAEAQAASEKRKKDAENSKKKSTDKSVTSQLPVTDLVRKENLIKENSNQENSKKKEKEKELPPSVALNSEEQEKTTPDGAREGASSLSKSESNFEIPDEYKGKMQLLQKTWKTHVQEHPNKAVMGIFLESLSKNVDVEQTQERIRRTVQDGANSPVRYFSTCMTNLYREIEFLEERSMKENHGQIFTYVPDNSIPATQEQFEKSRQEYLEMVKKRDAKEAEKLAEEKAQRDSKYGIKQTPAQAQVELDEWIKEKEAQIINNDQSQIFDIPWMAPAAPQDDRPLPSKIETLSIAQLNPGITLDNLNKKLTDKGFQSITLEYIQAYSIPINPASYKQ